MNEQPGPQEQTTRPSFSEQLGNALLWLFRLGLRLLVVIVLGAILGGALYIGALFVYQRYVASVQENQSQLAALATRQVQDAQQARERMDNIADRLDSLEGQMDSAREALAEMQSQLGLLEDEIATQADLPQELATSQAQITDLEDSLRRSEATQSASFEDLGADLSAMEENIGELSDAIAELDQRTARLDAALGGENSPAALRAELDQLRVMGLILRSRLLVSLSNYNLALADLQLAGDRLSDLAREASGRPREQFESALDLLGAAADALPDEPVAAVDALEGAWQLLMEVDSFTPTTTPEDQATEAISTAEDSTVEPALTGTPTPSPTPVPSGTPTATTTPTS